MSGDLGQSAFASVLAGILIEGVKAAWRTSGRRDPFKPVEEEKRFQDELADALAKALRAAGVDSAESAQEWQVVLSAVEHVRKHNPHLITGLLSGLTPPDETPLLDEQRLAAAALRDLDPVRYKELIAELPEGATWAAMDNTQLGLYLIYTLLKSVSPPQREATVTATEPSVRFSVPFPQNTGFVGRQEDLATLHRLLQEQSAVGVRPAGVTGMAGIGKTQLAVEYAYQQKDDYPDGVFCLTPAPANELLSGLAQLARSIGFGQPGLDMTSLDVQRDLVRAFAQYLTAHPRSLLILDNVDDPTGCATRSCPA